ncbi:NucA/NucB deoxyribonuclease domain-containing protein [Kitasatospora sp. NPDC096077]|uniref:NucA/NucB deoxyribonuclease domain-containing protein n=1 Tax=Kitasatospora sp. NPDC096077 TaxID=3155544 RepID=UPI00332BDA9E
MARQEPTPPRTLFRPGRRQRAVRVLVALAAVLAALATTGQAQVAGAATPRGDEPRHYHRHLISISPDHSTKPGTPGGRLTGREPAPGRPAPADRVPPQLRIPVTGPDLMTVDECRGHDDAFGGTGWGKSRFAACQALNLKLVNQDCYLFICVTVGTATVEITDLQYGRNGGREVDVVQVLNNWTLDGDIAELLLSADVTCKAADGFGPCTVADGFGGPNIETIGQWIAEGTVTSRYYSFTQPATAGLGAAAISYANLAWHFALTGGDTGPDTTDGPDSKIRCDSAPYLTSTYAGEGCVFPWVTETVTFHHSDTPESVAHINLAQYHPDQTVPPKPGKSIPGAPGTSPLHRTADPTLIDGHRDTAVAACNTYYPGYAGRGLDCDEYPFASTLEGADNLTDDYSVDPIDDSDNRSAGGTLGAFYTGRRILGSDETNDPFYVATAP